MYCVYVLYMYIVYVYVFGKEMDWVSESGIKKANNWIRFGFGFGFVESMYILITNNQTKKQTNKNGYRNETKRELEMERDAKWIKMSTN